MEAAKARKKEMVARIDWLNACVDSMIAGKRPPLPRQLRAGNRIIGKDIELLKQSAQLVSLRPEASQPDALFVSRLREVMLEEALRQA